MRPWVRAFAVVFGFLLTAYSASGIDLRSLGYTVVSERREGERTVFEVEDSSRHRFTVTAEQEISRAEGELIERTLEEFYGWADLTVSYLRITVIDGTATVLVVPASYTYEGRDLTPYLPSGMQFYLSRNIEYDFRIKVERVFVRLRGILGEEQQFTDRLVQAIEDPAGFIERNDPEYVLRELRDVNEALTGLGRFDAELQAKLDELRENSLRVDDAIRADLAQTVSQLERLTDEYRESYQEAVDVFTQLRDDYRDTKAAGIEIAEAYYRTRDDLESLADTFESLHEDYGRFKEANAALFADQQQQNESLQQQISYLRYGFIAEANASFFGRLRPVDEAAALRIVQLKDADPDLTAKQIAATLKDEGFEANAKAVRFVLLAYRGLTGVD